VAKKKQVNPWSNGDDWTPRPTPNTIHFHPTGCQCTHHAAQWKRTKAYLDYIRRVDR
jgi:hypothetical protein